MYISSGQSVNRDTKILDQVFFLDSPMSKKICLIPSLRIISEFSLAVILLIIFAPIMVCVAMVISLTSKGGVFYSQERVGLNGKLFKIYKFRTMCSAAESKSGPVLATEFDSRITSVGKILRKTHLDELPQIFNVLLGSMSFIGPRPERPFFVNEFNKTIRNYKDRSSVKPGISGLAQICLSYDAVAEQKIEFDLMYVKNKDSLLFNILISYYTLKKMIFFKTYKGII